MTKRTLSKKTQWDMLEIYSYSDTARLYALTEQHIAALLTATQPMTWPSRFIQQYSESDTEDFVNELIEAIMSPVDFCQLMADCIDAINSTPVDQLTPGQLSLLAALESRYPGVGSPGVGLGPSYVLNPRPGLTDNFIVSASCSADSRYGIARAIVDVLFTTITDYYEQIEIATNTAELISTLLSNVTLLELINIFIEFGTWSQDTAAELWLAFDTLAIREELACDIAYMIGEQSCSLSIFDLVKWAGTQWSFNTELNSIDDLISAMLPLDSPELVGYSSITLMLMTISANAAFTGIMGTNHFLYLVQTFAGNSLLSPCIDPLPSDSVTADFRLSQAAGCWENIISYTGSPTVEGLQRYGGQEFEVPINTLVKSFTYNINLGFNVKHTLQIFDGDTYIGGLSNLNEGTHLVNINRFVNTARFVFTYGFTGQVRYLTTTYNGDVAGQFGC